MELELVSASTATGEPTGCAIVYRLEENSRLPVVSETHPWAGRAICALRDRSLGYYVELLVHWLAS